MKKILKKPLIIIPGVTLLSLIILIIILSSSPLYSLQSFFIGPFSNSHSLLSMLKRAAPLMLTSLGAFIALRADSFNLGGEGQVYLGATLFAVLANYTDSGVLLYSVAFITPGLFTAFSGYLQEKYRINSLITTYLISMILIIFCNYLISGPFIRENSNILTTNKISETLLLDNISPLVLSVIIVVSVTLLLERSVLGYKYKVSGSNKIYAGLMGIKTTRYRIGGIFLSGGFHGLAGAILVSGILGSAIVDSYIGLGWNGLSSSLIAGSNSIFIIFSSLFYSYLDAGARYATIVSDVTLELSEIIKSILFFVISSRLLKNHFIKRGRI